jgi:hypothetical protein
MACTGTTLLLLLPCSRASSTSVLVRKKKRRCVTVWISSITALVHPKPRRYRVRPQFPYGLIRIRNLFPSFCLLVIQYDDVSLVLMPCHFFNCTRHCELLASKRVDDADTWLHCPLCAAWIELTQNKIWWHWYLVFWRSSVQTPVRGPAVLTGSVLVPCPLRPRQMAGQHQKWSHESLLVQLLCCPTYLCIVIVNFLKKPKVN